MLTPQFGVFVFQGGGRLVCVWVCLCCYVLSVSLLLLSCLSCPPALFVLSGRGMTNQRWSLCVCSFLRCLSFAPWLRFDECLHVWVYAPFSLPLHVSVPSLLCVCCVSAMLAFAGCWLPAPPPHTNPSAACPHRPPAAAVTLLGVVVSPIPSLLLCWPLRFSSTIEQEGTPEFEALAC